MTSKFKNNLIDMKSNPEDIMKIELENLMKKNPEDLISSVWVKMEDEKGDVESFEEVWVSLQDNSPKEEQEPPQNNYIDDMGKGQPPPTKRKLRRTNYQTQQLQCTLCNYKTVHKNSFKAHMLSHDNLNRMKHIPDKTFKCTKCLYTTANSESFKKHTRLHLKEKIYHCDKCPFKTKFQVNIHRHLMLLHKVLETAIIGEFYRTTTLKKWRLNSRKQRSKKNYPLSCTHCQFQTLYHCELKNHTNMFHYREAHESTVTMNVGIDTEDVVKKAVMGQQIPLERTVEQITKQAESLPKQEEEHNDSNDVEVASTDYSYDWTTKTKDQIVLHVERSISNVIHNCSVCGYNTKYKCQYVNHMKKHSTFMCPSCDYSSKKKFNLARHFSKVHLRVGFKCQYCDYVSAKKDSLLFHEAGHTCVQLG